MFSILLDDGHDARDRCSCPRASLAATRQSCSAPVRRSSSGGGSAEAAQTTSTTARRCWRAAAPTPAAMLETTRGATVEAMPGWDSTPPPLPLSQRRLRTARYRGARTGASPLREETRQRPWRELPSRQDYGGVDTLADRGATLLLGRTPPCLALRLARDTVWPMMTGQRCGPWRR